MLPKNFPGGPVIKNLPANAGDTGSIPRQIPHASDQLSQCTTATEPMLFSQQEKPRSYERQVLAAAASVTAALNKPKGSSTDFF